MDYHEKLCIFLCFDWNHLFYKCFYEQIYILQFVLLHFLSEMQNFRLIMIWSQIFLIYSFNFPISYLNQSLNLNGFTKHHFFYQTTTTILKLILLYSLTIFLGLDGVVLVFLFTTIFNWLFVLTSFKINYSKWFISQILQFPLEKQISNNQLKFVTLFRNIPKSNFGIL